MKQNNRCGRTQVNQIAPVESSDIEAERAVLAVVLLDPSRISDVVSALEAIDFTDQANRSIYAAMLRLERRGLPADATLVLGELLDRSLINCGHAVTATMLIDLFQLFPLAKHLTFYLDRLLEMSKRRNSINRSSKH